MEAFTMEIAGAAVRVQPLFQSTGEYCKPFFTERNPDFCVQIRAEDLLFQQMLLEREAVEEGLKIRKFTDPFLERATIQRRVADFLLGRNTLMMHGSTVSVDGVAYLFTAPCGTGKSTHTRLWRELFSERAMMVNDDNAFLRMTSSGVLVYGSPWSGKHGLASNVCVPLNGICLLHRGSENRICRVDAERLRDTLRQQVYTPVDASLEERTGLLIDTLSKAVPLWEMYCNKEMDAAMVAYSAMSRDYE